MPFVRITIVWTCQWPFFEAKLKRIYTSDKKSELQIKYIIQFLQAYLPAAAPAIANTTHATT